MPVARSAVTPGVLALDALTGSVTAAHAGPVGAVASFLGLVRAENLGRAVTWLDYEAYEPLAVKSFARIADEAAAEWPDATIGVPGNLNPNAGRINGTAGPQRALQFAARFSF